MEVVTCKHESKMQSQSADSCSEILTCTVDQQLLADQQLRTAFVLTHARQASRIIRMET